MAVDYLSAMQRVEQRLQVGREKKDEVVKVQVSKPITQLEMAELEAEELPDIASQLCEVQARKLATNAMK